MSAACSDCGAHRAVMLTCEALVARRRVEWQVCSACWIRVNREIKEDLELMALRAAKNR